MVEGVFPGFTGGTPWSANAVATETRNPQLRKAKTVRPCMLSSVVGRRGLYAIVCGSWSNVVEHLHKRSVTCEQTRSDAARTAGAGHRARIARASSRDGSGCGS